LIQALELSQSLALRDVELVGDALEVIRQANLALHVDNPKPGHPAAFRALADQGPPARIRWIKRGQNLAGIALAARHPR
jgi:ribonuclease HI